MSIWHGLYSVTMNLPVSIHCSQQSHYRKLTIRVPYITAYTWVGINVEHIIFITGDDIECDRRGTDGTNCDHKCTLRLVLLKFSRIFTRLKQNNIITYIVYIRQKKRIIIEKTPTHSLNYQAVTSIELNFLTLSHLLSQILLFSIICFDNFFFSAF